LVVAALWKNIRPLSNVLWGMLIFSYLTFTYFGSVSFVSLHKLGAPDGSQPSTSTILGIVQTKPTLEPRLSFPSRWASMLPRPLPIFEPACTPDALEAGHLVCTALQQAHDP
jgi:hypothetical protein